MLNPYEVLGVSPLNTKDEIKAKYRKLCKSYHPDIAGEGYEDKFREVNEAWKLIKGSISDDKPRQFWSHKSLFSIIKRSM